MKRLIVAALAASLSLAGAVVAFAEDAPKVGIVVKIGGIPWFTAMQEGIKKKSEELGITGEMIGPV